MDYRHYDPPRDLSALLPQHTFHHAFIRKASSFRQIRDLRRQGFDVYVNLCEAYVEWDVPSIDVIAALDRLDLPYTGPSLALYDPPKHLMKLVACSETVLSPAYVLARSERDVADALSRLRFPLFVKPDWAGDSRGIDENALVRSPDALAKQVSTVLKEYDEVLIEEYVDGREFSVLVCADPDPTREALALRPVQRSIHLSTTPPQFASSSFASAEHGQTGLLASESIRSPRANRATRLDRTRSRDSNRSGATLTTARDSIVFSGARRASNERCGPPQ